MTLVERLQAGFHTIHAALAPAVPLVTRVVLGAAFVQTGIGKWQHFDNTVTFFTNIGIPAPAANAAFIATLEAAGGAALVLGAGTRIFAALLSSTMIVAMLTADRAAFTGALLMRGDKGLLDVVPFVYLLFLGWLFAAGAGAISVDRIFAKKTSLTSAGARAAGARS